MAPRKSRRSAAAAAPPPEDVHEADEQGSELSDAEGSPAPPSPDRAQGASTALKFKDTLLGRPGRPIPVATLLKRLQSLAEELKSLEQAESDEFKESCKPVAKELSDNSILGHKDNGVRAYAAQCIVDLLALCAPDAPFSTQALKAAFELIIKTVFPALADPSHAYNAQHVYVLDSLADVKSILLVQDLPSANKLITQLFATFFDIYAGTARASGGDEPVSKHVEYNMLNIMVTLVDEAESLPQEVVDIIVAQFLRADPKLFGQRDDKPKKGEKSDDKQATLIRKELPTPYVAAKNICTMVPEKMAREISKYFSDVILEASGANTDGARRKSSGDVDDMEESTIGPSEEDMNELRKAHRLVRELWRACPPVLQSVVPQLEAELSAENVQLRVLATETLGDMISGIGAAGAPPPMLLDPAAFPPLKLSKAADTINFDPLTTPASPQSFPQTHPQTYTSFLGRRQDKAAPVRATWTTAIGRILSTNAGGVGLNHNEEQRLVVDLGRMMNDADEKVRFTSIKSMGALNCHDAINKLGSGGGVDDDGTAFANLGAHVKDKRAVVRIEAMQTLARFWAAAHGEIADNREEVIKVIGGAPRFVFEAFYVNSLELNESIEKVVFETLLPLSYPPIKTKGKDKSNGASQRKESQQSQAGKENEEIDPDQIRAERMVLMVNCLNERARTAFFAMGQRQATFSKYILSYLESCELYNGGVMDKDEKAKEQRLSYLIEQTSKMFEDRQRVHADLWKFAKVHDRRNYQLIRFCIDPKSDYRTVIKAMRELNKRVSDSSNPSLMETLTPILYRAALLLYNRSHVPAILQFSKTNEKGLGKVSHLLLKDISEKSPAVLETDIQEMCQSLMDNYPSSGKASSPTTLDTLKACAAFARGYPHKLPKDRKFIQALSNYTLYGSPPEAGKHAVSIILGASEKKGPAAKDILRKCLKGFRYGQEGFLSRLAAMSQVMLLAPEESEEFQEQVFTIVMEDILTKVRTQSDDRGYVWSEEQDEECAAKCWAIKVVVNRIRSYPHHEIDKLRSVADPILATLSYIVANEGDLSPSKDTPATHKPQLRLLAAHSLLKLCRLHRHDQLLDPLAFVKLAEVAQDGLFDVRNAFIQRIRKYINRGSLPPRFYTIPFLLAYEPTPTLKSDTITWLKSRAALIATQTTNTADQSAKSPKAKAQTVMEATVSRLISLLAHHLDYDDKDTEGVLELARYLLLYLTTVASAENISLIYGVAQRVKAHRDAVLSTSVSAFATRMKPSLKSVDYDVRLHTLSDLTCAIIRAFVEAQGWNLQSLPGRATLPKALFQEIRDHDEAINVAEKDYLTDEIVEGLDLLVREALRKRAKPDHRKRKSEAVPGDDEDGSSKRVKRASTSKVKTERTSKSAKKVKTPKRRGDDWESGSEEESREPRDSEAARNRRKSGRASNAVTYGERKDDEDDQEMLDGVAEWEYENGVRLKEGGDDSEDSNDSESDEQDEEEEQAEEPVPKAKARAKESVADKDVEMADNSDVSEQSDDAPGRRKTSKATKDKTVSKTATPKAPSASKSGRSGPKAAKSSPVAVKHALPTRSGRTTRAAAR